MTDRHHVLIVEDDAFMSEDLGLLLDAMDCTHELAANKADALRRFDSKSFCLVLLDLEIKSDSGAVKGHKEFGLALLREIRSLRPEPAGVHAYRLPVIVVSGHMGEADDAMQAVKDGADEVLPKPLNDRRGTTREKILGCLLASGRETHQACLRIDASTPRLSRLGLLVLTIPGTCIRGRTRVEISGRTADIPAASLRLLVRLLLGRMEGKPVHKRDLGWTSDHGFKGPSRLRYDLRPAMPENVDPVSSLGNGYYELCRDIEAGHLALETLVQHDDAKVREHAEQLISLRRLSP